jgi:uncharacterized protein
MVNLKIKRAYNLDDLIKKGKVLVIYGPRRVGKTTLLKDFLNNTKYKYSLESGDNMMLQDKFNQLKFDDILEHVEELEIYAIDEAQQIKNIGAALKIIVDEVKDIIVIATGSSSFDLANKIGEPLVGRKETITLYPLSIYELSKQYRKIEIQNMLENLLIYGGYPQVFTEQNIFAKQKILEELVSGNLLKDIFTLENLKAPNQFLHLLKLMALYIGQPISYSKLASETGLNLKTVQRYLDLLEKNFVLFRLNPYNHKLSNTLKYKPKYYFWDLGIRNAVLNNFNTLDLRNDIGSMWENFCFIERVKSNDYKRERLPRYFFYKTYDDGKEIDIIEEYNGYTAIECKYKSDVNEILLEEWDREYPNSKTKVMHKGNFLDFLI